MAPKFKQPPYSNESMNAAIRAVMYGMSKRSAAKQFDVPRTTLNDKISGRYREGKRRGRDPFLKEDEESALVT